MEAELLTQLDIVSPKVVFADLSTLSTVEKALELYNGPPFTIYLLEDEKQYGSHVQHSHISMLWNRGSMQWEKLSGRETLSNRYVESFFDLCAAALQVSVCSYQGTSQTCTPGIQ